MAQRIVDSCLEAELVALVPRHVPAVLGAGPSDAIDEPARNCLLERRRARRNGLVNLGRRTVESRSALEIVVRCCHCCKSIESFGHAHPVALLCEADQRFAGQFVGSLQVVLGERAVRDRVRHPGGEGLIA